MVGVQGGSKGCKRCRKRKVKCDEARPGCRRCAKAGLECGGYPDIFQHDALSSVRKSGPSSSSRIIQPKPEEHPPSTDEMMSSFLSKASARGTEPTLFDSWLPGFLNLLSFDDTICVTYTNDNLLKGAARVKNAETPFIIPGLSSFNKTGLTRNCILALSFTFFGQQHNVSEVTRKGTLMYASSLRELNESLRDPEGCRSIETFEAIAVMTLYELLMGVKTDGWSSHSLGLEVLFRMHGPHIFTTSPSALGFFENTRIMIINACMLTMKKCLLAEPEWKTVPWSGGFSEKSDLQLLYDIFVDVPGVMMYLRDPINPGLRLRTECDGDPDLIYLESSALLEELGKWYQYWFAKECGNFFETEPTFRPANWLGTQEDLAWTTVWHFAELYTAQSYATYNALLMLLLQVMNSLENSGLLTVAHPTFDRSAQIYQAAIEICRCIDYHLMEPHSGAGSLFVLMPARFAWKYLGDDSNEGKWMQAAAVEISKGQRGRWAIAAGTFKHYNSPAYATSAPYLEPSVEAAQRP